MTTITTEDWLKLNALRIADHHRETCEGETCNISLSGLAELLDAANIKLTPEERARFL